MKNKILLLGFFLFSLVSCLNKKEDKDKEHAIIKDSIETESYIYTNSKADSIIKNAIKMHGGELYETANYSFVFREKKYQFKNDGKNFTYSSEAKRNDSIIKDVLTNQKLERFANGKLQVLNEEKNKKYTEALNSVIYFATLPYKLNDASVNKKYIEEIAIKGVFYDTIEITFNQEGGGKDYDDVFYYWINKKTHKIDYLAYSYHVNEGGVRFRESYNRRVVDGITFQDYINYEAPFGTPLKELPKLFEENKLKELSRIDIENIINNK